MNLRKDSKKQTLRTAFTIFVFVALASLDNAVIGLFPPLFTSISRDLGIPISSLGSVSALSFLVISLSSIVWGYLADRGHRKRLVIIGTLIWAVSVYMTSLSKTYYQLMTAQIFTGIGLGCIGAIGFSILTDYIPKKFCGMLMSLWGMSQGFGGIAGSVMASVVATASGWRRPFEILAILGFSFTILYFFIKEPPKGGAEPELKELRDSGGHYHYRMNARQLLGTLTRGSNLWLVLQGFFMNITLGTLIWLPTLYASKLEHLGYDSGTSVVAAGFLYALLQIGGLSSMYFGHLGDRLHKKSPKGRPILTGLLVLSAAPLYVGMFLIPMKSLSLTDSEKTSAVLVSLVQQILIHPWTFLMFTLAVCATAAQSANTPNWLAMITDMNLPEHRATVFSVANLIGGLGRAMGNMLLGLALAYFSHRLPEPGNFVATLSLFQIFFIPAALCYSMVSKYSSTDLRYVRSTLNRRSKVR